LPFHCNISNFFIVGRDIRSSTIHRELTCAAMSTVKEPQCYFVHT
jgi:hypothetical protein